VTIEEDCDDEYDDDIFGEDDRKAKIMKLSDE